MGQAKSRATSLPTANIWFTQIGQNIALFDIETGGRRDLMTTGTWEQVAAQYGEQAIWSHNSRLLAYNWSVDGPTKEKSAMQLRIMEADGTNERVVYQPKKPQIVWPVSWSGDGKQVFVQLADRKDDMTFVLINVTDGSARNLKSFEPPFPAQFQLSQDARYIVYSQVPREGLASRDLFLLDTQNRDVAPLLDHPADDYFPYWTPDGRWIVFLSNRGGAIRFRDGRPLGEPRLIHSRLDDIVPKGFDKQGSYYYAAWQSRSNVYTAEVDFANNAVIKAPEKLVSKYQGRNTAAGWSPDGAKLVYLSRLGPQRLDARLSILDLEYGREAELQPGSPMSRLNRYSNLQWGVDGKSLLIMGADEREQSAWFRIDAATGRVTQIKLPNPPGSPDSWALSPDGRFVYFSKARQVVRIDIEKGAAQILHQLRSEESDLRGLAVSPDGAQQGRGGGAGWTNPPRGAGAHMFERVNTRQRPAMSHFDEPGTPRFYGNGSPENAGAAHNRFHDATRTGGIALQRGEVNNAHLSDVELLNLYRDAYCHPELQTIRGSLRTPNGSINLGDNLTPAEAWEALMQWSGSQGSLRSN